MKNKYQHNDDGTTFIFLESKGKHFPGKHIIIIGTEDWDKVKEHRWFIKGSSNDSTPYARTSVKAEGHYIRSDNGWKQTKWTTVHMHHVLMGKPESGLCIDHKNHNGLDNRRENLRKVTIAENNRNKVEKK
jgi:hypothetical protein